MSDANTTLHKDIGISKYLHISIVALCTLHAFLMNGYYYLHRQLTTGTYLSSLFASADPSLFKNSIYVQAVNRSNLRISLFYDMCPFILKHCDFETFAMVQAVVSLFFVLAGIFTLTRTLFNSTAAGYISMLLYTAELNNWTLGSPAPYLNFFHHGLPYSYPLIVWSMVFFFRRNYLFSFLLAGLSWNFHPMLTAFLLAAYAFYLLIHWRDLTLSTVLACALAFALPALPVIIKSSQHLGSDSASGQLWLTAVRWVAGYTCFPSSWPREGLARAGMFLLFFMVSLLAMPREQVKRVAIFVTAVVILCTIGTLGADFHPVPFIIKMSLWRSTFLYLVLAVCCMGYALRTMLDHGVTGRFLALSLAVLLTGYLKSFPLHYFLLFIGFSLPLILKKWSAARVPLRAKRFPLLFFGTLVLLTAYHLLSHTHGMRLLLFFLFTFLFLLAALLQESYRMRFSLLRHTWALPVLFVVLFDSAVLIHRGGPEIYYHGRMQGRTDPWAEVQLFARARSDRDDLFIVPPYLNDFTTYSQRAVLGDWAEGSTLLYLDNRFTYEWFERMHDLGCKPYNWFHEYNSLDTDTVVTAARKYGARFAVTEKPHHFHLPCIYENERFLLYHIRLPDDPRQKPGNG